MHRSFKLHHRRQTGKLIHHRHTSYLALVLVVVSAGFCMLLTDSQARAATLSVTATLPVDLPSGAPVITLPANNTIVDSPDVHFEGICPVSEPPVAIALYDKSQLLASGACHPDGTFAITASLTRETRSVTAKIVSATGEAGTASAPLAIAYQASQAQTSSKTPVAILSDQPLIAYDRQTVGSWKGYFIGGSAPYTVSIDWGDGHAQTYKDIGGELQTFLHGYADSASDDTVITVTDAKGNSASRHLAAISLSTDQPAAGIGSIAGLVDHSSYASYLVWFSLLVVLLWLWRYEFLTHRKVVAVPVHYQWQKQRSSRQKPGKLQN